MKGAVDIQYLIYAIYDKFKDSADFGKYRLNILFCDDEMQRNLVTEHIEKGFEQILDKDGITWLIKELDFNVIVTGTVLSGGTYQTYSKGRLFSEVHIQGIGETEKKVYATEMFCGLRFKTFEFTNLKLTTESYTVRDKCFTACQIENLIIKHCNIKMPYVFNNLLCTESLVKNLVLDDVKIYVYKGILSEEFLKTSDLLALNTRLVNIDIRNTRVIDEYAIYDDGYYYMNNIVKKTERLKELRIEYNEYTHKLLNVIRIINEDRKMFNSGNTVKTYLDGVCLGDRL